MKKVGYTTLIFAVFMQLSCKKNSTPAVTTTPTNPVTATKTPTIATTKNWLTDKNVTDQTAALFYNLQLSAKSHVLFGHQDDTKRGVQDASTQWANEQQFTGIENTRSDVKTVTGAYPAVY